MNDDITPDPFTDDETRRVEGAQVMRRRSRARDERGRHLPGRTQSVEEAKKPCALGAEQRLELLAGHVRASPAAAGGVGAWISVAPCFPHILYRYIGADQRRAGNRVRSTGQDQPIGRAAAML